MSRRTLRVEDLVRRELSEILLREVHDPRVRLVTLSAVTVSPDLEHARIAVSLYGSEEERLDAVDALCRAATFLRGRLARRLRDLRRVPHLTFELDRGPEHAERIGTLLENLAHDDEST